MNVFLGGLSHKSLISLVAALAFLVTSAGTGAQAPDSPRRLGFILNSYPQAAVDRGETANTSFGSIESRLRELGWTPRSLETSVLSADSQYDRFPKLVDELVRRRVEVIVVFGPEAARVARERAPAVPLVEAMGFNRPAGRTADNVTGPVIANPVLKRLEILKAVAPQARKVAMFARVAPGSKPPELTPPLLQAVKAMGMDAFAVYFDTPEELDAAFVTVRRRGADAVYMSTFPRLTWESGVRSLIVGLSARHRLPTVHEDVDMAEDGGLVAFGPSDHDLYRRAAYYVDRILRGTNVADLPREEPNQFFLRINRRTARDLGLALPPALVLQADRIFD